MQKPVVLLPPEPAGGSAAGPSSWLPADLWPQVRRRVGLLALLLGIAFGFDLLLHAASTLVAWLQGPEGSSTTPASPPFLIANGAAAVASLVLWRTARRERLNSSTLLSVGLVYEVVICFILAVTIMLDHYRERGFLPNLTWVPVVVILFPMMLPGPPARMLKGAIASAAMVPLAMGLLDAAGAIQTTFEAYLQASIASGFAVIFAAAGARTIYGLGREIAESREMGSYHLEERLGQGGMGEVWRARHRLLARPAAIKLIRPSLTASPDVRRRFEREAQVIAGLRSPHTVDLYDFGVTTDGAFYYVMELLEGLDADRLIRQFGPIAPERAIHLLRQVCHSLSEAESRGLVHRDIKPANIFVSRYGEEHDFVKVLDFGIVKTLADEQERQPQLTQENRVPGSPAFIAPEQPEGAPIDGRADIYATGCVGFWLLTGQTVFSAETPMGLLVQHAGTAPPRPSSRTPAPIPEALDDLVLECLAKDPAQRPQTAGVLAQRLAAVATQSPWTEARARQWWVEHLEPDESPAADPTNAGNGMGRLPRVP